MQLRAVPAFADNYIWMLADDAGDAVLVDPGDAAAAEAALHHHQLRLRAILVTHHHADHIGGIAALLQAHSTVRVLAPDDARIKGDWPRVTHGQQVELAQPRLTLHVLALPGHTRSHVAYHCAPWLFCGDALFSLGCGRLFEGTADDLLTSMRRISALPDDSLIAPAHEYTLANAAFACAVEPDNADLQARVQQARAQRADGAPTLPVSLASERACNPFLRWQTPAVRAWGRRQGMDGDDPAALLGLLRGAKDAFRA